MDEVKLLNFEKAWPNQRFPEFRSLSKEECDSIRVSLRKKLGADNSTTRLGIVKLVATRGQIIDKFDAESSDFDLEQAVELLTGYKPERVLVNWFRFDVIDELRLSDFSKYFDDIWYPASDDIDIFDWGLKWLVSISSSGVLSVNRFET